MPGNPAADLGRILVVDDEPELREALAEHLRSRGLEVATAADGRAAVLAIEREPTAFGLMFVDLALPAVDGFGVLKAARSAGACAEIVIITGYASIARAVEAVRLGAYDFLPKPFALAQVDLVLTRLQVRLSLEKRNERLALQVAQLLEIRAAVEQGFSTLHSRLTRIERRLDMESPV